MENNCSVRRLKVVAANDSLFEFGSMRLVLRVTNGYIKSIDTVWNDMEGIDVTLLDDGVTFTTGENGATVIDSKHGNLGTNQSAILNLSGVPANNLINVKINKKYGIVLFKAGGGNLSTDDMKYFSSRFVAVDLSYAGINGNITGDIDVFSKYPNIEDFQLQYTDISGSVTSIGNLTKLTRLNIGETSINGNWVDFVSKQVENGKTSNTNGIRINMAHYTNVLFGNNSEYPRFTDASSLAVLKWSNSNKIALENASIKKVYLYGYSDSEVQNYISQEYTVITAD